MTRHSLSQLRLSPLRLQQGLFASLALSVTLIGGQQWARWETAAQPVATVVHAAAPQQHFQALGAVIEGTGHYALAASDDTQIANTQPLPERWVF